MATSKKLALVEGEHLLSEVGEKILNQAQREAETLWASESDVDEYVDGVPDEWLVCREGNRHKFPTLAETRGKPIDFIDNRDGLLVAAPKPCERCGMAYREDLYEIVGRGKNARLHRVTGSTKYYAKLGPQGQRYQARPGHGRITSAMVRDSLATKAMGGMTPTEIKKQAALRAAEIKAEQEIAEAARKAEREAKKVAPVVHSAAS